MSVSVIGCGTGQKEGTIAKSDTLEQHEGIIAEIDKTQDAAGHGHQGWYSILLIPNLDDVDILNKTEEELIEIAQKNKGAYYSVSPEMHDELEIDVGMKVIVYWDLNVGEGESDPPVRDAEKIHITSK